MNQTFTNFEILIIDDGSSDGTDQKVRRIADKRIRYSNNGHIGNISTLRNIGVDISHGEYIAFCDDDDIWHHEKLEIQLKFMKDFSITCTNAELIDIDGQSKNIIYCSDFNNNIQIDTTHLFLRNYIITSTVLLKKSILTKLPFDSVKYKSTAEDFDLWMKLSLKHPICFINKPLIKYRIHENLSYKKDNLPQIYINSISILYNYMYSVPKRFRKYAIWSVNKYRIELIKLNIAGKRIMLALKELLKITWDFRHIGYLYLIIYKILYPKRKITNLIKKTDIIK